MFALVEMNDFGSIFNVQGKQTDSSRNNWTKLHGSILVHSMFDTYVMPSSICSLKHPKICRKPWEFSLQQIPTCLYMYITGPWSTYMWGQANFGWWRQVWETQKTGKAKQSSSLKKSLWKIWVWQYGRLLSPSIKRRKSLFPSLRRVDEITHSKGLFWVTNIQPLPLIHSQSLGNT